MCSFATPRMPPEPQASAAVCGGGGDGVGVGGHGLFTSKALIEYEVSPGGARVRAHVVAVHHDPVRPSVHEGGRRHLVVVDRPDDLARDLILGREVHQDEVIGERRRATIVQCPRQTIRPGITTPARSCCGHGCRCRARPGRGCPRRWSRASSGRTRRRSSSRCPAGGSRWQGSSVTMTVTSEPKTGPRPWTLRRHRTITVHR